MSRKPVIGITVESTHEPSNLRSGGSLRLNWNYAALVSEAGGVPILIPPTADMDVVAGILDGWLIPGGLDIDAGRWGEDNHPTVELQDPARFDSEERLYRALKPQTPIFGICYGSQFLNVVRGGSLVQHLPDVVGHGEHSGGTLQTYTLENATKLRAIIGTGTAAGKSYHHQAVGQLGEGLQVNARHADGTIEGLEDPSRPWCVGVQWHPERTPDDPATRALFTAFLEACRWPA